MCVWVPGTCKLNLQLALHRVNKTRLLIPCCSSWTGEHCKYVMTVVTSWGCKVITAVTYLKWTQTFKFGKLFGTVILNIVMTWAQKVRPGKVLSCHHVLLSYIIHRTIIMCLISTAQTRFFYTTQHVRQGPKLSAIKYNPRGASLPTPLIISLFFFQKKHSYWLLFLVKQWSYLLKVRKQKSSPAQTKGHQKKSSRVDCGI